MRAQTTTDFAVGMGLFLLTIVVVVGFLPSVFEPFETRTGPNAIAADRSADRLADDLLARAPERPAVLNDTCTASFFDTTDSNPPGCRYDADAADLTAALGVRSFTNVNVTIRNESGVRLLDGTKLAAGSEPYEGADVVTARRTVLVGGNTSRLVVKVW